MKKLLYIAYIRENQHIGWAKKVENQCLSFEKSGFETYLYICINQNRSCFYKFSKNNKICLNEFNINPHKKNKIMNKYFRFVNFIDEIEKIMSNIDFDIIYIRRISPVTRNMIKFLKRQKKYNRIILWEYPTYPYLKENLKSKQYMGALFDSISDHTLKKYVDFYPAVLGEEIQLSNMFIPIFNGINIENIKIREKKIRGNRIINLIGIAHVEYWHGYDRVIEGLKNYYSNTPNLEVYFHIVGDGGALTSLKELVSKYNLQDKVIFHGIKTGKELDDLVNIADVGIGSLANHRKKLTRDSALKNREYCARGIPFIIASDDSAFKKDFKYILKVEPNETPIDIKKVIEFYNSVKDKDYTNEMRKYAEKNLTWEAVMKPVIDAINNKMNKNI